MFGQVLATEFLKLRRTKVTWLSWLALSFMPLAGGLFMWIAKEPERAAGLGLMGQKAQLAGVTADWASYFTVLNQVACVGGMVLLAVIATYVFGREFADGTAKNMLTQPVSRHWFGVAKLIVVLVWFFTLVASIIVEGLLVGSLLKLPGFSTSLALSSIGDVVFSGFVCFLLVPAVAWIATLGRGYLPPIGFTIFMLVLGNVFGATGWGKWFPWSIVPMLAGIAGPRVEVLDPGSIVVVGLTFIAGVAATLSQLRWADNAQ